MPTDVASFASRNFRGPMLPEIDQARRQNALGNLAVQQQQNAVNRIPQANRMEDLRIQATEQDIEQQRRTNAGTFLARGFSSIARSSTPKAAAAQFLQSPNFRQAAEAYGWTPDYVAQFSIAPEDTDESIASSALDHARTLGAPEQPKRNVEWKDLGDRLVPVYADTGEDVTGLAPKPKSLTPNQAATQPSLLTPEGVDLAAQEYLNSAKLPSGLGKGASSQNAKIISRAAEIAAANGDDAKAAALRRLSVSAGKTALAALTRQRTLVGAFERTALKNLEIALEESQKVSRGGVPALNRWILSGKKNLGGDVEVGRFNAALTSALNEYAKVLSGATGASGITDAARREADEILRTANTPEQVIGIIDIMKREMANREAGFAEQEAQLKESFAGAPAVTVAPAATGAPVAPGAPATTPNSPAADQQSAGRVLVYDPVTRKFR